MIKPTLSFNSKAEISSAYSVWLKRFGLLVVTLLVLIPSIWGLNQLVRSEWAQSLIGQSPKEYLPIRFSWGSSNKKIPVESNGSSGGSVSVGGTPSKGSLQGVSLLPGVPNYAPVLFKSECIARSGQKVNLAGLQKQGYGLRLAPNTVIDASTAYWDGTSSSGTPIAWTTTFSGDGPACWYGGKYTGVWNDADPTVTWANPYHHSGAMTIRSPQFLVEAMRVDNQGDGIRMEGNAQGFRIRGVYLSNIHDDCIENDHMNSGTVEDSLFDGCYSGISSDHTDLRLNGSDDTVVFKNNLLYMKPMNTVFRGVAPGTAMLFKGWSNVGASAPAMVIENNIFRIDQKPGFESHNIPPRMNIKSCSNNIIVWTGPGDWPYKYPACFRITKDINVWYKAVNQWKTAHPTVR